MTTKYRKFLLKILCSLHMFCTFLEMNAPKMSVNIKKILEENVIGFKNSF